MFKARGTHHEQITRELNVGLSRVTKPPISPAVRGIKRPVGAYRLAASGDH